MRILIQGIGGRQGRGGPDSSFDPLALGFRNNEIHYAQGMIVAVAIGEGFLAWGGDRAISRPAVHFLEQGRQGAVIVGGRDVL